MPQYTITHRTTYEYTAPVAVSHHVARLEPRNTARQERQSFKLSVTPEPVLKKDRADYFGNQLCFFSIQQVHRCLQVVAISQVVVRDAHPLEDSPRWEDVARFFVDPVAPEQVEPLQFVFDSPHARASFELADYARASFRSGTHLLAGAADLMRRIHADFAYDRKATTIATPLEEVLRKRRGVCQDFAHVAIGCLRSLGLPARYVSGYIRTHAPSGQPRLIGADASHAWFSVFCPERGWLDFDPTNNLLPSLEHITVAYGRDFGDVSPVAGILTGGGSHALTVNVEVA